MHRRGKVGVALGVAAVAATVFGAGPAQAAQSSLPLTCGGSQYIVSTNNNNSSQNGGWSAAQVAGGGHFIPTMFVFSAQDVTQNFTVFSDTSVKGQGNANQNQPTTTCTAVFGEGTWAELSGGEPLPPGVNPTDMILASITVTAVPKGV